MSSRKKLIRFKETREMDCIIQGSEEHVLATLSSRLKGRKDLILELGCGNGAYAVALAKMNPDKICIGVDIQGERLWYGGKRALEEKIDNVMFLRIPIELLSKYLPKHSVAQIWITFPDPYPRNKNVNKRLTSLPFLEMYRQLLTPHGRICLKTDDVELFDFSLKSIEDAGGTVLECLPNIPFPSNREILNVQTFFEEKHRKNGKKIGYIDFSLQ